MYNPYGISDPEWSDKEKRWTARKMMKGVRYKAHSPIPGKKGAKQAKDRLLEKIENNGVVKSNWNFRKCWDLFLEDIIVRTGTSHAKQTSKLGSAYILPEIGNKIVGELSEQDFQNVINYAKPIGKLKKDGTRVFYQKELSKKTLQDIRGIIVAFCRFCKKSRIMEFIPEYLSIPRSAPKRGKKILQPHEFRELIDEKNDEEWYINAWRLMVCTGLRPGECYGLKKTDIMVVTTSKDTGLLIIKRSINETNEVTEGKNNNAKRKIPIKKTVLEIIRKQLKKIEHLETDWLFPDKIGGQPKPKALYDEWSRIKKEKGFEATPYGLRHTFISFLHGYITKEKLEPIVGHSKSMDTFNTYSQDVDGELEKIGETIDENLQRILNAA